MKCITPPTASTPAAVFKAQPLPDMSQPQFVPQASNKSLTAPEPFGLHTEDRGALANAQLHEQLRLQEEEEKKRRHFRAAPMPVFEPFTVVIQHRGIVLLCFCMSTEYALT